MTDHTSSIHPDDGNEPEHLAYEAEDEIDLVELIKPLWQQKIFIAGFTFLVVALAVVLVLKATPQYKIYVRLKPGTYRWDSKGTPIPYLKTTDLKGLITGGAFDIYAAEASLGDKAPKVEASSNRRGDQLAAYFFWPDPTEGKKSWAASLIFSMILIGDRRAKNFPACGFSVWPWIKRSRNFRKRSRPPMSRSRKKN